MDSSLILVHISKVEANAFARIQNGANIDSEIGVPNFKKAADMILHKKAVKEAFIKNFQNIEALPEGDKVQLKKQTEKLLGHDSVTTESQNDNAFVENIAEKGKKDDKVLCLMPVDFVKFLATLKKPTVNKSTGLFEFFWGAAVAAIGAIASFGFGSSSANKAKKAIQDAENARRDAIARALATGKAYLRDVGYYDKWKPDNRPWRLDERGVKEYFNPKTGEPVSSEEAWKLKSVRDSDEKEFEDSPPKASALWTRKRNRYKISDPEPEPDPIDVPDDAPFSPRRPGGSKSFMPYEPTAEEQKKIDIYKAKRWGVPDYDMSGVRALARGRLSPVQAALNQQDKQKRAVAQLEGKDPASSMTMEKLNALTKKYRALEDLPVPPPPPSVLFLEETKKNNKKPLDSEQDLFKTLADKYHNDIPIIRRIRGMKDSFSKKRYAVGGTVEESHSPGGIVGKGTGQSDDIHAALPVGTYILPADVVSHLGDGSSSAGIKHLNDTFKKLAPAEHVRKQIVEKYSKVPVRVANEEYKIDPATVNKLGGSQVFDKFVKNVRKHSRENGLGLPPAAKPIHEYLK